nr:MAG: HAD-hyrolase-like [Candidatus Kentron sp. TUN]VFK64262.1 MAG: HAD-hyrolase-like [Candidatus Kentron sp. TUN]
MTELAVEPENTLVIGDSSHDLKMARNAGVDAVAVTYGVLRDKTRLLQYQPRTCLDALGELVDWLAYERSC